MISWSRKKSCSHCRASKARCSKGLPKCSRCAERSLGCVYEENGLARTAPYPHYHSSRETAQVTRPTLDESMTPVSEGFFGDAVPYDQIQDTDAFLNYLDLPQEMQVECASSNTFAVSFSEVYGQDTPSWLNSSQPNLPLVSAPKPSLTLSTTDIHSSSSSQRTLMRRGAHSRCPLTSMVLGQIMSYPRLLIEGDQLPPFIHPGCYIDEELAHDCMDSDAHVCLPKRIAACATLVRIFYDRRNRESDFVWDVIRREADEIHGQVQDGLITGAADQLAALQSLTILLLLQAEVPGSASEHGAGGMIEAIMTLITQMKARYAWDRDLPEGRPDRNEWTLRESLRRIIALLSVIDLLLEGLMSTSTTFRHEFNDIPLPAPRTLWNARTNRRWRLAYDQWTASRKMSRLLRVSDLVESDEAGCFAGRTVGEMQREGAFADVVRWCEGADVLGTLVWMAMPFEQHRRRTVQ